MKKRLTGAAVALAAVVTSTVAAAPTASAAPCTITGFSPRTIVVGLSPVAKTFGVSADCPVDGWSIDIVDTPLYAYSGAPREVVYPPPNGVAGEKYDVVVEVDNDLDTSSRVFTDAFVVKRRTSFTAINAGPEPVRKGKTLTVTGTLKVADWDANRYVALRGSTVDVQFKKKGSSSYKTVRTVKTSSTGGVRATFRATYDGTFRLSYGGSAARGPATSGGDSVDVR